MQCRFNQTTGRGEEYNNNRLKKEVEESTMAVYAKSFPAFSLEQANHDNPPIQGFNSSPPLSLSLSHLLMVQVAPPHLCINLSFKAQASNSISCSCRCGSLDPPPPPIPVRGRITHTQLLHLHLITEILAGRSTGCALCENFSIGLAVLEILE